MKLYSKILFWSWVSIVVPWGVLIWFGVETNFISTAFQHNNLIVPVLPIIFQLFWLLAAIIFIIRRKLKATAVGLTEWAIYVQTVFSAIVISVTLLIILYL